MTRPRHLAPSDMFARSAPVDFHSALDLRLFRLLNRDGGPWLDGLMRALSSHTFGVLFGLLLCVALAAGLRRAAARPIVALGLGLVASDALGAQLLRPLIGRMRPCYALPPGTFRWLAPAADAGSLPSLHAANMFALALVVSRARPRLAPLAYAVAVAVSLSRVYVGVHWPTDVLAGALWGTIAGGLAWAVTARRARGDAR